MLSKKFYCILLKTYNCKMENKEIQAKLQEIEETIKSLKLT